MEQFRFANPEYAWVIFLAIGLLFFSVWSNHRAQKLLRRLAHPRNLNWMVGRAANLRPTLPDYILSISIACIGLALMRPQADPILEDVISEGIDIVVALDVSRSMDAEDVFPSRLRMAKKTIGDLLGKLSSDKIGIVAFAGSAHLVVPLTTDFDLVRSILPSLDTNLIEQQGSNIEEALQAATHSFERGSATALGGENAGHVVLIMSDGEETTGAAVDAARKARIAGITVHAIVYGTERGVPIPIRDSGGVLQGHKRDRSGNTVTTRVNYKSLQDIASAGGGVFAFANLDNSDIDAILTQHQDSMKADSKSMRQTRVYQELYTIPLGIGMCLLIIFFLFPALKAKRVRYKHSIILLFFLYAQLSTAYAEEKKPAAGLPWYSFFWTKDKQVTEEAKQLLAAGESLEAQRLLERAQTNGLASPTMAFNAATALANTDKTEDAKAAFAKPEAFGESLQHLAAFDRAGLEAKSGNKTAAQEAYFDQIQKLQKQEKRSKLEDAVLDRAIKNIELLQQEQKNQDRSKQQKDGDSQSKSDSSKRDQQKSDKQESQQGQPQNQQEQQQQSQEKEQLAQQQKQEEQKMQAQENSSQQKTNARAAPHRFTERQDLSETDAKRILENLKTQESDLQRKLLKMQVNDKNEKSTKNEKDW